ncbi:hypothetical protein E1K68_11175 [Pseudomonas sp. B2021]|uniref:Uncharacterized protein n=1 Tax=Pseudomonas lactis TaxID=1615674 RepID=I4K4E6_9PSED|nr:MULTISPECIES: hypothetical protein [Pseudomonas]EIK59586.1 hypothetical protein PflSS101_2067 [Pseudomonas lactis]MBR7213326.1 hypothetical protein [Pseudomonas sp. B2021]
MPDATDATLQPVNIEYLQDTLFGVNTLASECMAQLVRAAPGVQLRLAPPWPAQLLKAHWISFEWNGQAYRGVVQEAKSLTNGDLLLDIEPQP